MSDFNPDINIGKIQPPTPPPSPPLDKEDRKIHEVALPILQNTPVTSARKILNASSQNTGINSFEHITRYLSGCEELLKQTDGKEKEIATLCQDLAEGNWAKILQKDALETLPLYALRACHDGKITGEQFSTLLIYWSAFSQLPPDQIIVQPIFDAQERVDPRVSTWIKATIGGELRDINSKMTLFFADMKTKTKSEQSFLHIPIETYVNAKSTLDKERAKKEADITGRAEEEFLVEYEETVCDAIARIDFNVLHQFEHLDIPHRMIPSLSMMQLFLEAQGKEHTVKITPVIGLSSREDIRTNGREGTRDMALPFPGVELPKEADLMSAPLAIDFTYHDFYHSIMANNVPDQWRKAFIECSDSVLELIEEEQDENLKKILNEFYERLIDMEYPLFRNFDAEEALSNQELFFVSLYDQEENTMNRLFPVKVYQAVTEPDYWEKRESKMTATLDKVAISHVIGKLAKKLQETDFCLRYNITQEDLLSRKASLELEESSLSLENREKRDLALQFYEFLK